jgi:gamma-glutamyl-gamma-aminobutyrate hydrolase PuuD
VANAFATSPAGELVEGVETRGGRFVIGIQCHPERQESTPAAFERLFRVFVDACRGAVSER